MKTLKQHEADFLARAQRRAYAINFCEQLEGVRRRELARVAELERQAEALALCRRQPIFDNVLRAMEFDLGVSIAPAVKAKALEVAKKMLEEGAKVDMSVSRDCVRGTFNVELVVAFVKPPAFHIRREITDREMAL